MYKIINTSEGFMVVDESTGEYAHDEEGNNCFDSIKETQKFLFIVRVREAIDTMFEAIEEGDPETIAHLAIRYKQLFGTKEKSK
jgi:hypothetical protein